MFYRVKAKLKKDKAKELLERIQDGSISKNGPDGEEMINGFERAGVDDSGTVEWSMVCYCPTPLAHERATVLDHYFDELTTEVIKDYELHDGRRFIEYLEEAARS
ncbi:hypothetical protein KS4_25010 [Poriferisphaera corsica]|uniref:Uncharacterized protein n=1 Tax=Poriferisphaera corsica TaxID=2528020 RepID=A0A517YW25_9BACT|nr:hypothetical protein [Poriferisphaera corsica]QDU34431.1 hypothetical protein KS4_25010 [Poriferisphaera corsica]